MTNDRKYITELASWTKTSAISRRGHHQVEFLAAMDDIKEALAAGYPMRTIWDNMTAVGRISGSYELFVNYVKKYELKPHKRY